ncbi:hypothetical protein HLB23_18665 [Nocardia uniformis]|uniref:Outer membrane channel protein CpnT-like N-terminal domain-containing protein n=1 Tax=Nocardia uniformis TaxID=53432 RepID=A0A849C7K6_9NOCA|nr:hypothetical protein [Nocardia uniformis]NNH71857.1 hypothetical protein [Nocardia uniformis]
MGDIPGYLKWLEWVAGSEWPHGDEDGMWALADDWRTAAADLREVLPYLDDAKYKTLTAYPSGEGVEEMTKLFDGLRTGDTSLEKMAEAFDQLAEGADGVGTEIDYAKLMMITSLALLAAEIAAAWIFPPTAPAVSAAAITITRMGIRAIAVRLMSAVARHVGGMRTWLQFLAKHVAIDFAIGVGQEVGIQAWQISQDHRKDLNLDQIVVAAASSAAGGAAAGPIGDKMGDWLGNRMKPWMSGALTGAGAGLVGGTVGVYAGAATQLGLDTLVHGKSWDESWGNFQNAATDWHSILGGAAPAGVLSGALTGASKAQATQYYHGRYPDIYRATPDLGGLNRIGNLPGVPPGGLGDPTPDGSAPPPSQAGGNDPGGSNDPGRNQSPGDSGNQNSGRGPGAGDDGGESRANAPSPGAGPGDTRAGVPGADDGAAPGDARTGEQGSGAGPDAGAPLGDSRAGLPDDGAGPGDSPAGAPSVGDGPGDAPGADQTADPGTPGQADSGGARTTGEADGDGSSRSTGEGEGGTGESGAAPGRSADRTDADTPTGSDDSAAPRAGGPQANPSGSSSTTDNVTGTTDSPTSTTPAVDSRVGAGPADAGTSTGLTPPIGAIPPAGTTGAPAATAGAATGGAAPARGGEVRPQPGTSPPARVSPAPAVTPLGDASRADQQQTPDDSDTHTGEQRADTPASPSDGDSRTAVRNSDSDDTNVGDASRAGAAQPHSGISPVEPSSNVQARTTDSEVAPRRTTEEDDTSLLADPGPVPPVPAPAPSAPDPSTPAGPTTGQSTNRRVDNENPSDDTSSDGDQRPDDQRQDDDQRADDSSRTDNDSRTNDDSRTEGDRNSRGPAQQALADIKAATDSESIRVPDRTVGPDGMYPEELVLAAGGEMRRFTDHDAMAQRMRDEGAYRRRRGEDDRIFALVVDSAADGASPRPYLMVHENGRITVREPGADAGQPFPPTIPQDLSTTHALLFDNAGKPIHALTDETRAHYARALLRRLEEDAADDETPPAPDEEPQQPRPDEEETRQPQPDEDGARQPQPDEGESRRPESDEGEVRQPRPGDEESPQPQPDGESRQPLPDEAESRQPQRDEEESRQPLPDEGETRQRQPDGDESRQSGPDENKVSRPEVDADESRTPVPGVGEPVAPATPRAESDLDSSGAGDESALPVVRGEGPVARNQLEEQSSPEQQVVPAAGDGGSKKPPSEPPVPPASPDEPADDGSPRKPRPDSDSDDSSVLEPSDILPPAGDDTTDATIDIDGESVPVRLAPDGTHRWRVVTPGDGENRTSSEDSTTPKRESALRRMWNRLRDKIYIRGHEGDNPKYPSGSGEDGRGQTALRDAVVNAPDLVGPDPTPAPPAPPPQGPVVRENPAAGGGDEFPNVVRILKESITFWQNRENIPILKHLSSRIATQAGEHMPLYTSDGDEYQPWITDGDPDAVRQGIVTTLENGLTTPEQARADLELLLSSVSDAELRRRILVDLAVDDLSTPEDVRTGLLDLLNTATDPELRERIIDSLYDNDLIDAAEAARLDRTPIPEQSTEVEPLPEPDAPPADESLTDMARRLGFDLPDEDPETVRRVLDEQQYRVLRAAGAIEGLGDAARRLHEEVSRPYSWRDADGTPGANDDGRSGTSVPIGEVSRSFFDDNPMGHFVHDLLNAMGENPGLRGTPGVNNGADPLPEWNKVGENPELGRDDGLPPYFQHALRRDQLVDELSTWTQMFGLDINDIDPSNPDPTLDRLRAANNDRAAGLADFAAAAADVLARADDPSGVGEPYGDQIARIPLGEGQPDLLVVIDGARGRDEVLADTLAAHPDLGTALRDGEVQVDYRQVRTDESGQTHLDQVDTPRVHHHRENLDGRELIVTMVRDGDGDWRAVPHTVEPVSDMPAAADGARDRGADPDPDAVPDAGMPRSPEELLREMGALARELGLDLDDLGISPDGVHPERLTDTVALQKILNALRASQIEALADFIRTNNDIQTFYDIAQRRAPLAQRLGLSEAELTPRAIADGLTDASQRKALRIQQIQDIAAYAKQLRGVDAAAVDAARDRLARQLGVKPEDLFPDKYVKNEAGRLVFEPDPSGLDAAKLRKLIFDLEQDGDPRLLRNALAEYAAALMAVDPYSEVPRGDRAADPRNADAEAPVHDTDALSGLRDIVADATPSRDPLDFPRAVADAVARAQARNGDEASPGAGDPTTRPQSGADWARLVGVDLAATDNETFRKVYEAYRDGRIDKHEGLSPADLAAAVDALRDEVGHRADQISALAKLAEEFHRLAQQGRLPGDGPATPDPPDGPTPAGPPSDSGPKSDGGDTGALPPHTAEPTAPQLDQSGQDKASEVDTVELDTSEVDTVELDTSEVDTLELETPESGPERPGAPTPSQGREPFGSDKSADGGAPPPTVPGADGGSQQPPIGPPGDGGPTDPPSEPPSGAGDSEGSDGRPRDNRDPLDDIRQFLAQPEVRDGGVDPVPLTDAEREYVRRLAAALGLEASFAGNRDPLGTLRELAEIARARGFLDDPDNAATMRYPDDFDPLTVDELHGGEDFWREADPELRQRIVAELRSMGLGYLTTVAPAITAGPDVAQLSPSGSDADPSSGNRAPQPHPTPTLVRGDADLASDLTRRLGLTDADVHPDSIDRTIAHLRYWNLLTAGAIEGLADSIARHEAATDAVHQRQIAATRDGWAQLLSIDSSALRPDSHARTLADLRAETMRRAEDIAALADSARTVPPDPTAGDTRKLVLDVDGERIPVTLRLDGNGTPRVSDPDNPSEGVLEPRPDNLPERLDTRHAELLNKLADPKQRFTLRERWELAKIEWQIAKRDGLLRQQLREQFSPSTFGYGGPYPKYPSGSGWDGEGQTALSDMAGITDPDASGTFNPARIAKEGFLMGRKRELIPLMNLLRRIPFLRWLATGRTPDEAGEHIPVLDEDGDEYQYWIDDADADLLAEMEEELKLAGLMDPDDTFFPATDSRELPSTNTPEIVAGESHSDPDGPSRSTDNGSEPIARTSQDEELLAAARAAGIRLPDTDPETVRRVLAEHEYRAMRRAAAIEGLAEAARRYIAEDARLPFLREVAFDDNDPLGRFLNELVAMDGGQTLLHWGGVNNGAEPGPHWADPREGELSDSENDGLREHFENALRRDQIQDERSVWAQLLGVDLTDLGPRDLTDLTADEVVRALLDLPQDQRLRLFSDLYIDFLSELVSGLPPDVLNPVLAQVDPADFRLHFPGMSAAELAEHLSSLSPEALEPFLGNMGEPTLARILADLDAGQLRELLAGRDPSDRAELLAGLDRADVIRIQQELSEARLRRTVDLLRQEIGDRADALAEFARVAAPHLRADADPERMRQLLDEWTGAHRGRPLGDGVVRMPDPDRGPDRLVVFDGHGDRDRLLADTLAAHPDLADAVNHGDAIVDYRAAWVDRTGELHVDTTDTPQVRHFHGEVDGHDVNVTLLRDGDAPWQPVPDIASESAGTDSLPIRDRTAAELRSELDRLAGELGIDPADPNLARTVADQLVANALRAAQVEGLADFARSAKDIETFATINAARDRLANRLGIDPRNPTPEAIADALTEPNRRNASQRQRIQDLTSYAKQLSGHINSDAVSAARDQLARRLGIAPELLRPGKYLMGDDPHFAAMGENRESNEHIYVPHADKKRIDPGALFDEIAQQLRTGNADRARQALEEFARALLELDPYTDVGGNRTADPRAGDGEVRVSDADSPGQLRDIVGDPAAFTDALADPTRQPGIDPAGPPRASRDWARIIGVDITDADAEQLAKVYGEYRDGKIEKHEGLTPEELTRLQAELRTELRQRARQLEELAALVEERQRRATEDAPAPTPPADDPGARIDAALQRESDLLDDAARQRRAVMDILAADSAAAVRERDAALAALRDAMVGLPVNEADVTSGRQRAADTVEGLRDTTMRVLDMPSRLAAIDALEAAATRFDDAVDRLAILDRAMATAMERDTLLTAGASLVTDRVGVVDGEPPVILVVGWTDTDAPQVWDQARQQHSELAELADQGVPVQRLIIDFDDQGRITVTRGDINPEVAEQSAEPPAAQRDSVDPLARFDASVRAADERFDELLRQTNERLDEVQRTIDAGFDELLREIESGPDEEGLESSASPDASPAAQQDSADPLARFDASVRAADERFDELLRQTNERLDEVQRTIDAGFDELLREIENGPDDDGPEPSAPPAGRPDSPPDTPSSGTARTPDTDTPDDSAGIPRTPGVDGALDTPAWGDTSPNAAGAQPDSQSAAAPGVRSLDSSADQVRDLLAQTEVGRRLLALLDNGPISERFDLAHEDGRAGELRRGELAVVTYTSGTDHVRQALVMAHESVHAQYLLDGRSAREEIRTLDRDAFIRAMIDEEVEANIRRIELAQELRDLGYDIRAEENTRRIEQKYLDTYARGVSEAAMTPFVLRDPSMAMDPDATHAFARDLAAAAIRADITALASDSGQTYADFYGAAWDRLNTPVDEDGPRTHSPTTAEAADRLRNAALRQQAARLRTEQAAAELADAATALGLDPTADPNSLREAANQRREQLSDEPAADTTPELRRLDHDLRTLADLADQYELARFEVQQRSDELAADAARDVLTAMPPAEGQLLGDHVALIPGAPDRLVVAAPPGEHQRVLDEVARNPEAAHRISRAGEPERIAVETDRNGRVRVDSDDLPQATPTNRVAEIDPEFLAATATAARVDRLLGVLADLPAGQWASQTLHDLGVQVVHRSDAPPRFFPARDTLVLDPGMTDGEYLLAMVHAAIHADIAHRDPVSAAQRRMQSSREDYVRRMVAAESRAYALEVVVARQLRAAGYDLPVSPLEQIYTDAFDAARADVENAIPDTPVAELDRIANQAGLQALRPVLADHRPADSESYAESYGRAWDVAHGVRSFADRVDDALASGIAAREVRGEPAGARWTERITFNNGTVLDRVIMLTGPRRDAELDARYADAEELAMLVGRAVGANVPQVHRHRSTVLYLEPMSGTVVSDKFVNAHEMYLDEPGARELGLLNVLTGAPGRDGYGWMLGAGNTVIGIGHHLSFGNDTVAGNTLSPFAEHFQHRRPDGTVHPVDHTLTPSELAAIRRRLEGLRQEFATRGREQWYDAMLERLSELKNAAAPELPEDAVPVPGGGFLAEAGTIYINRYGGDENYGLFASVSADGVLFLDLKVGPETPSGSVMFADAMRALGDRVQAIEGNWFGRPGTLTDNLATFDATLQAGFTPEEAARYTHTGQLAAQYGFTEVSIDRTTLEGPPSEHVGVTVRFTRPDDTDGDTVPDPAHAHPLERTDEGPEFFDGNGWVSESVVPESDWSPRPDDVWSTLDRDGVAELLGQRWDLEVRGFDDLRVDVEVLREFARAIDDMLTLRPDAHLQAVEIGSSFDPAAFMDTWPETHAGRLRTAKVVMNIDWAANPHAWAAEAREGEARGFHIPGTGTRPIYAIVIHEFGHVLDFDGQGISRGMVVDALTRHFVDKYGWDGTMQPLLDWLAQLSAYSFMDADRYGRLNKPEALADAFLDVVLNGSAASEPAAVLYRLLNTVAAAHGVPDRGGEVQQLPPGSTSDNRPDSDHISRIDASDHRRSPEDRTGRQADELPPTDDGRPAAAHDPGGPAASDSDADWSPRPADEWSALDRDEIEQRLREHFGLEVEGFANSRVDPEVLREVARALDDVLTRYGIIDLRRIVIGPIPDDPDVYAHAWPAFADDGSLYTDRIVLNESFASDPAEFARWLRRDEANGIVPGSGARPVFSTIVHELGHALDHAGGKRARAGALDALFDHYEQTYAAIDVDDPAQVQRFHDWWHQLSFYGWDEGRFNAHEALAEAFTDVELNGEVASEPAKVLYWTLLDAIAQQSNSHAAFVDGTGLDPEGPGRRRSPDSGTTPSLEPDNPLQPTGTRGYRSHIPHPPHEFEVELPDFPHIAPMPPGPWPIPEPPASPEPPTPPERPQPPEWPDLPLPPNLPDLPGTPPPPELPDVPVPPQPELPDVPLPPDLPVPQPPQPDLPDLPGSPLPPELPDVPVPPQPELPDVPFPPDLPIPRPPQPPELPDLPPPPGLPDLSDPPRVPDQPVPSVPELPDFPGLPNPPAPPGAPTYPDGPAVQQPSWPNPQHSGSAPNPSMPPLPPMPPGQSGAAPGAHHRRPAERGNGPRTNGIDNSDRNGEIVVRPYTGFGAFASFDPTTGRLQAMPMDVRQLGGVFGDLGEIRAVFYRAAGRLALRLGEWVIDLDDPAVRVHWAHTARRMARFAITAGDAVVFDIGYQSIGGDLDMGLLIRDVLADPIRRTEMFK